jgi:small conductance mechanosensitive channel
VGDVVETNGEFGKVEKISIRYTVVATPQGQKTIIPNRKVLDSLLKNYTISGERRIDLECGISYGDDLQKVKNIAIEAIEKIEGIDSSKKVEFFYVGFGDSSINFVVRYWIQFSSQQEYMEARSQGVMRLKSAFDENNITIPFPIRTLDFGIKGGLPMSHELKNNKVKAPN